MQAKVQVSNPWDYLGGVCSLFVLAAKCHWLRLSFLLITALLFVFTHHLVNQVFEFFESKRVAMDLNSGLASSLYALDWQLQRRRLAHALTLPDATKPATPSQQTTAAGGGAARDVAATTASTANAHGPFPPGTRQRALEVNRAKLLTWHTGNAHKCPTAPAVSRQVFLALTHIICASNTVSSSLLSKCGLCLEQLLVLTLFCVYSSFIFMCGS